MLYCIYSTLSRKTSNSIMQNLTPQLGRDPRKKLTE